MSRVGRHVGVRFGAFLIGLLAGSVLLFWALGAVLHWSGPSPWSVVMPLGVLAAWLTRRRTLALGEDVAIAASGTSPVSEVGFAAIVLLVAQLVLCWPGEQLAPTDEVKWGRVLHSLDAPERLLVARGPTQPALVLDGGGALAEVSAVATRADAPGFVPARFRSGRARAQLFFAHPPTSPSDHPLDPAPWRWIYVAAGFVVALACMRQRLR